MKSQKNKNMRSKLPVYGMTCSACKSKVEKALENEKGVLSAKVSLKNKEVVIKHSSTTTLASLKKIISGTGYSTSKSSATRQGLLYGLLPHAGCIVFILASVLGASFFMNLLRPLMMSASFFYALIFISFIFATISALIYLRRNGFLNFDGVRRQKKYLATLYTITIGINLALFLVIFPLSANFAAASSSTATEDSEVFDMEVTIPCSGHAPLIINEVGALEGVQNVRYSFPYNFEVTYDVEVTSPQKILEAEIFEEFPASYDGLDEVSSSEFAGTDTSNVESSCAGCAARGASCSSCSGSCGGDGESCSNQGACSFN